jgi:broad specificity phosphatase PhoE
MGHEFPPTPIAEHLKERAILDEINSADLPRALELFDNVAETLDKHPEALEDEKVKIHLNALIRRLEELGYDPLEENTDTEDTLH